MPRSAKDLPALALALGFTLLVAAPAVVAASRGFPFVQGRENRSPAEFPLLARDRAAEFPGAFEKWFNDRFAFRRALVQASSWLRYQISVPSSPSVIIGHHDFLFFTGDGALDNYRRIAVLDAHERKQWRELLEQRRSGFAARGIHYLAVFNPDKETVYPEEMPESLTRLDHESALQGITRELGHTAVHFVDTTASILRAKAARQLVFHRTDTHWNGFGRYAAYQAVLEPIHGWFPAVKGLPFDELRIDTNYGSGGDLAAMLDLLEYVPEWQGTEVSVRHPRAQKVPYDGKVAAYTLPQFLPVAWEVPDDTLPRAVIIGDSFMNPYSGLAPYLAENFRRTLYVGHHDFDTALVERERPDVVIEGFLERFLLSTIPAARSELDVHARPVAEQTPPPGMDEPRTAATGVSLPPLASWELRDLEPSADGTLVAGAAPSARASVTPFEASGAATVWISLTAFPERTAEGEDTRPIWGHLLWTRDDEGFAELRSALFAVVVDGKPHRYRVRPSVSSAWEGRITSLRLDLPRRRVAAKYQLDDLQVFP